MITRFVDNLIIVAMVSHVYREHLKKRKSLELREIQAGLPI